MTRSKIKDAPKMSRREATQTAIMRSVECLAAENGLENIAIRDILARAGQKNESALQYHFKNLSGLLAAIRRARAQEVAARRQQYLEVLLDKSPKLNLRQICSVMVMPAFDLAKTAPGFKTYIQAFGHELMGADRERVEAHTRALGDSAFETGVLLQKALPHLDRVTYHTRVEHAFRFVSAAMNQHAQQPRAFKGKSAEIFVQNLIDALEGLLKAPVSAETRAASEK